MNKADWSNEHRLSILGHPIVWIPESAKSCSNFLEWWLQVGRLKPKDPQGWSSISGPGVMKNRVEAIGEAGQAQVGLVDSIVPHAISPEEWDALPKSEQDLIQSWAEDLPISVFYD